MNLPFYSRSSGLSWLAGLLVAACTTASPQPDRVAVPDRLYEFLNAGEIALAGEAVQEALESRLSNETHRWDSGSGSSGTVMPVRTYRIKSGHYCRNYLETLAKNSQHLSADRTACRDSRGVWRVVKR